LFPIDDLIREVNATTFMNTNLKEEIDWLKKCLIATNSPTVFSHNDFGGSNILVIEDKSHKNFDDSNIIKLCDFEYSCYSYRGFDFGTLFENWGRIDYQTFSPIPSDQFIEEFMKGYLDECCKIYGNNYRNNKLNSMQQLLKETKVFTLAQHMLSVMFSLRIDDYPNQKSKKEILVNLTNYTISSIILNFLNR
jgi:thiamine kinase-like enzyme